MKHYNITISGYVQGVGFRYLARAIAKEIGITGFVKNLPGNKVYIEAEGNNQQLSTFVGWCYKGPVHARIDNVSIAEEEIKNFDGFEVRL